MKWIDSKYDGDCPCSLASDYLKRTQGLYRVRSLFYAVFFTHTKTDPKSGATSNGVRGNCQPFKIILKLVIKSGRSDQ